MSERDETRITVRIPTALYEELQRYARGDGKRPAASVNAALVFLLQVGLREERRRWESEEEGHEPALLPAAA